MKKNSRMGRILKPFENNTSTQLLIFGTISYVLLCILANQWHFISDGIIQMHTAKPVALWKNFINYAINIASLSLLMFVIGRMVYSKTRFIDVFTVVLVTHFFILLIGLSLFNPMQQRFLNELLPKIVNGSLQEGSVQSNEMFRMAAFGMLGLLLMIYFFFLLIQGMKIAINSKKGYHGLIIVISTLVLDLILLITRPYFI